jgi:hypothetical protein
MNVARRVLLVDPAHFNVSWLSIPQWTQAPGPPAPPAPPVMPKTRARVSATTSQHSRPPEPRWTFLRLEASREAPPLLRERGDYRPRHRSGTAASADCMSLRLDRWVAD